MIHGWHNNDYFLLFEEQRDAISITLRYGINQFLPGYTICGLKSWDDFIITDDLGQFFTVPTVPLAAHYIRPYNFKVDVAEVMPDVKIGERIKWYITPLVFGGNPQTPDNMAWISLDQHVDAVRWWNQMYIDLRQQSKIG